jgi:hypothetical protein
MQSFVQIINSWPTAEEFGRGIGIPGGTARQWRNRDSIPASYWTAVVSAAEARGIEGISYEMLAHIAAEARNGAPHPAPAETAPEAA